MRILATHVHSLRSTGLLTALALAAVVAPAAASGAASAPANKAPCMATPKTFAGHPGMAFCGPATAVLKVKGTTYTFVHGFCSNNSKNGLALQLSLGAAVPSISNSSNFGQPYLTIAIHKTPLEGIVSAVRSGKVLVRPSNITIAGTLPRSGTFAAKGGSASFSGSWNCHGVVWDQSS
jgi:hypothetical protein